MSFLRINSPPWLSEESHDFPQESYSHSLKRLRYSPITTQPTLLMASTCIQSFSLPQDPALLNKNTKLQLTPSLHSPEVLNSVHRKTLLSHKNVIEQPTFSLSSPSSLASTLYTTMNNPLPTNIFQTLLSSPKPFTTPCSVIRLPNASPPQPMSRGRPIVISGGPPPSLSQDGHLL